jgi:L-asparaginase / beta-aspartyl-peptidase
MRTAISTSMILLWGILTSCEQSMSDNQSQTAARPAYVLVIHGGAGTIEREKMSEDLEKAYRHALNMALDQGEKVLKNGGTAEDAVIASILYMEDDSLFNAGKGAVLNYDGTHELDASIMTGHDLKAGAVTGVKTIKNPILAARAVKDQSDHVLLAGAGADEFAKSQELQTVNNPYFTTEKRRLALDKIQNQRDTTK